MPPFDPSKAARRTSATTPAPRTTTSAIVAKPKVIPIVHANMGILKPPMKSWSFSSLGDFEKCKFYSFLKRVQKIPEPERPLPPGKMEHANDRGSRIHDWAEMYVRGKEKDMVSEMRSFETEFLSLRDSFNAGRVMLEGEWGMDENWEPVDWKDAWLRLKLDALVFLSPTEVVAVDYKTGRKFGNEIKHAEQLQLYQLVTFLRYPQVETVHTELWYLDQDELTTMTYQRHQGLRFKEKWNKRGSAMMNAVDFPPNPNAHSCRFCYYGPKGSGVCERGV